MNATMKWILGVLLVLAVVTGAVFVWPIPQMIQTASDAQVLQVVEQPAPAVEEPAAPVTPEPPTTPASVLEPDDYLNDVVTALGGIYTYPDLPECNNPDESTPLAGAKQNDKGLWEINIHENGCNLVFEGLIVPGERLHRVIVLRSANGEMPGYVQNGVFTYSEGSIWQKPRVKNMEDVANLNDPAEALKLLNDKRAVMDANGYDWPIVLYFTDGTVTEFGPGEVWEGLNPQNHCDLQEPVKINVHGEKLAGKNQFSAAIGATNCITVAWIDGANAPLQWTGQRDAQNKVVYTTISAWLMPSTWSPDDIAEWIADQ